MMHGNKTSIVFVAVCLSWVQAKPYELSLIGSLNDLSSISRHTSSFIDCLHHQKDIKLQLFKSCKGSSSDLSPHAACIFNDATQVITGQQITEYVRTYTKISGVVVHTRPGYQSPAQLKQFEPLLHKDALRIASSVYETTKLPSSRVAGINAYCDAVIVPDQWLVDVYKTSGIKKPIFVLPLVLDLKSLLDCPIKKQANKQFVFGFSGVFLAHGRKNHERLMEAFVAEFGGNRDVELVLHGRGFEGAGLQDVLKPFNALQTHNITLACNGFDRKGYEDFLASLDCYVSVAKGEGFSIIPREILALGIPCILANNTAQKTICNTGFVCPVVSNIEEKATELAGNWFNTRREDLRVALRDAYDNYVFYLEQARKGREWVKQYLAENLAAKYRSLVAPKLVILGDKNELADDYIMTNSPELFEKYKKNCNGHKAQFHVMGETMRGV